MSNRSDRGRPAESEKITVNLGPVDLGRIDLLVSEGFYASRTDFIRNAIRGQISRHDEVVERTVSRRQIDLGIRRYSRSDLEAVVARGETLAIDVLGLVVIEPEVSVDLALSAIESLHVLGTLQASADVRAALKSRTM